MTQTVATREITTDSWEPPASMVAALASFERLVQQIDGAEMAPTRIADGHNVFSLVKTIEVPNFVVDAIAA